MATTARRNCLVCGKTRLTPMLILSEEGLPHGDAGHKFAYSYDIVSTCDACDHGQLEKFSHDCFSFYEDEDWNMYWWFEFDPSEGIRWRELANQCPDRLNAQCDCSIHQKLRFSCEQMSGDARHAISPNEKAEYSWIVLEIGVDSPALKIDRQREMGRA